MHWARLEASALGSLIAACPTWKRREGSWSCSLGRGLVFFGLGLGLGLDISGLVNIAANNQLFAVYCQICFSGCVHVSVRDNVCTSDHTAPAARDVRLCRTMLHRSTWRHHQPRLAHPRRRTLRQVTRATQPPQQTWLLHLQALTWHRDDSLASDSTRKFTLFSPWACSHFSDYAKHCIENP